MTTSKKKIKECIIRLINEILNEDDSKVKQATRKTNLALYQQRQVEKRDAQDKLKLATAKQKMAKSIEDRKKAGEEFTKAKDTVKSKDDLVKAAHKQVQSS